MRNEKGWQKCHPFSGFGHKKRIEAGKPCFGA